MSGTRRRQVWSATSVRSDRFALAFLALAGLVGPAWALRDQAVQLVGDMRHRPAVAAPDVSLPHLAPGR
ncbi:MULTISPECIES: hypothetical protein [unclassified Streptomyces]|uniref:hypothetical protein n=1 Tax=unclassified Streptomyces TaxID=2593676 RepID=UPI0007C77941|nr:MULTISPECIES: hypothetical protein [unclassified Streptomyces]